ncbi:TetR/AcrR family transcriptional regulator [Klebsiella sp. LTGPAF-6F]|nr:TetR/AcrR family transcriptional regulator [Klebsiella sp. LTGPAF-6F]
MLLDAASRIFSERGVHVPLEAVVEASGVGRATLYRHFPDRKTLLLALFDRDIAPVLNAGEGLPPGEALIAMLTEMGRVTRKKPILEDAWRAIAMLHPEMQTRQRDLLARFEQPLADAIAAGQVRADLTLDDVISIGRMVTAGNRYAQGDELAGERILDIMLNGIRRRD